MLNMMYVLASLAVVCVVTGVTSDSQTPVFTVQLPDDLHSQSVHSVVEKLDEELVKVQQELTSQTGRLSNLKQSIDGLQLSMTSTKEDRSRIAKTLESNLDDLSKRLDKLETEPETKENQSRIAKTLDSNIEDLSNRFNKLETEQETKQDQSQIEETLNSNLEDLSQNHNKLEKEQENEDEFATESDNCHADAMCTNTDGSFTCACNAGYSGDGVTCADVDECATESDNCHADATCTNTDGSFTCACNAGYNGDGVTCADVDECAAESDNCHADAMCTNTDGSFTCACNAGYNGDGVTCTAPCKEGFAYLSSSRLCVKLSKASKVRSWSDSKKKCKKMGARLVILNTPERHNSVVQYLKQEIPDIYKVWVGMSKSWYSKQFKWSDGSTDVTQWAFEEPDYNTYQNCVRITFNDVDKGLVDFDCGEKNMFMCEHVI